MLASLAVLSALSAPALAQVDPRCLDLALQGTPEDYSEVAQSDFLQNYFALSTTLSPLHAPVPHEGGTGSLGIEAGLIPPLPCRRRLVLAYSKTEDTNKSPVVPKLRATFAFPQIGRTVIYAGGAYTPPIRFNGVSAVVLSAELGFGTKLGEALQVGARFHATSTRIVADIATAFEADDPALDDLFVASTFGVDGMVGYSLDNVVPYVSVGFTDASTFFYVGDDSVTVNNFHPYAGLVGSLGAEATLGERFKVAGELYAAPGGYSLPSETVETLEGVGRYGSLYTIRARASFEL